MTLKNEWLLDLKLLVRATFPVALGPESRGCYIGPCPRLKTTWGSFAFSLQTPGLGSRWRRQPWVWHLSFPGWVWEASLLLEPSGPIKNKKQHPFLLNSPVIWWYLYSSDITFRPWEFGSCRNPGASGESRVSECASQSCGSAFNILWLRRAREWLSECLPNREKKNHQRRAHWIRGFVCPVVEELAPWTVPWTVHPAGDS